MKINNRGMALPIVMMFIFLISIASVTLLRSSRQDLPQSFESLKHLQMKYIAKGAMQHARLKMTLLSTQAYDAAAYAVGKNPYYDHSAAYVGLSGGRLGPNDPSSRGAGGIVTNPGPAFITGQVDVDATSGDINSRTGERDVTLDGNDNQWDGGAFPLATVSFDPQNSLGQSIFEYGDNRYVGNLALVRFFEDISTLDPRKWNPPVGMGGGFTDQTGDNNYGFWLGSQQAVHIVSDVIDPVTGVADMFSASYDIRGMRVLATTGSRLYGSEAVSVTARVIIYTRGWSTNPTPPTGGQAGVQNLGGASFVESVDGMLEETSVFIVERKL